ncbi:Glycosylphosphatidylinositol anchor biosynthesis protein 11 [Cyphellophora attinorum]|uniref:Glycosylphosphatidylinositol anchor biosynthesis protein 11 n=1 Tax=Cyphellophora attinorum TaxID=1664694 RepID=A0A0N0NQ85_9EURO|nr:Glycosylphosphatidylinositol anchor biosynthesis protein 11 [Phialophora attinorum]KPI43409.1 Glycosylphosphatidylinositol anchor biosynthesis protein 11 [Phialophora attinorum]
MAPPPLAHIVHPPDAAPFPSSAPAPSRPRLLTPTTNPIPLLNTPSAQLYSLIHTALLPSLYFLRSSALVADPLRTLTYDIIPVATAQAIFCVLCVPSYGSWVSESPSATSSSNSSTASSTPNKNTSDKTNSASLITSGKSSIGRRKGLRTSTNSTHPTDPTLQTYLHRLLPATLSLVLTLLLPPVPLQIILHCLGAPLLPLSLLPHTLALATHLSLLIFYPLFYAHGVSGPAWRDVVSAWLPFDGAGVWGSSVGTIIGAWFGAVPIALDWDRAWQEWPITVVWGAVMGWLVGRVLTGKGMGGLGTGRRIDLSETEYRVVEVRERDGKSAGKTAGATPSGGGDDVVQQKPKEKERKKDR